MATLQRYRYIEQARIVALCDQDAGRSMRARQVLAQQGRPEARVLSVEQLCSCANVDVVYVCTNWDSHAGIAVQALRCDKHVALEIPAATNAIEAQRLMDAAAQSKGKVFLLENCCFDPFHLGMLGMVRQGLLGELTHLEGAYIHYLSNHAAVGYYGNPYPTHGIGPVAQLLGDDDFDYLVSVNGGNFTNHSLLKTRKGRSVLLQFDETTPRPYSRMQMVCGTAGFVQKYPLPTVQLADKLLTGDDAEQFVVQYVAPKYKELIAEGKAKQVKNIMNYVMDRCLMDSIANGSAFEISLDDALCWSSVIWLSQQSAQNDGKKVPFPTIS